MKSPHCICDRHTEFSGEAKRVVRNWVSLWITGGGPVCNMVAHRGRYGEEHTATSNFTQQNAMWPQPPVDPV